MPACKGTLPIWLGVGATEAHGAQHLTDCLLDGRPSGVEATVGW